MPAGPMNSSRNSSSHARQIHERYRLIPRGGLSEAQDGEQGEQQNRQKGKPPGDEQPGAQTARHATVYQYVRVGWGGEDLWPGLAMVWLLRIVLSR